MTDDFEDDSFEEQLPDPGARLRLAMLIGSIVAVVGTCIALTIAFSIQANREHERLATAAAHAPQAKPPTVRPQKQAIAIHQPVDAKEAADNSMAEFLYGISIFFFVVYLLFMVLALAMVVLWILAIIWVVRDCRSRSVDNGAMWAFIVLLSGWIGLIIYLSSRPPGSLIVCEQCHEKRLPLKRCPHCAAA